MKKYGLWFFLLMLTAGFLYAQNDTQDSAKSASVFRWPSFMRAEDASISSGIHRPRSFEINFASLNVGASTPLLNIKGLFNVKDLFALAAGTFDASTMFSIEDFLKKNDLTLDMGVQARVLNVRFNVFRLFTLDFGLSGESKMRASVPENTMDSIRTLYDYSRNPHNYTEFPELSGSVAVSGYAFAAVHLGIEKVFFRDKLLLRAVPQVFTPLYYIPGRNINLESSENTDYYVLQRTGGKDITVWSTPLNKIAMNAMGVDISLEGRYAIWPILDAGIAVENIPLTPATMRYSSGYTFDINFRIPKDSPSMQNMLLDYSFKNIDSSGDNASSTYSVNRPLRFDAYAIIKPFKSSFLLIQPDVGFSLLTPQSSGKLFNWGVQAQLNLPILLSLTAGTRLFEEIWIQYLNMSLRLLILEVNLGVSLRGTTFVNSWEDGGFGFQAALKIGI